VVHRVGRALHDFAEHDDGSRSTFPVMAHGVMTIAAVAYQARLSAAKCRCSTSRGAFLGDRAPCTCWKVMRLR
jgi:hypothetical protein